jgi:ABC-type multidrug transport system permease subunit
MNYRDRWRNLGFMVAYVAFNTGVAFASFYLAKVATFDLRRGRVWKRGRN